KVGGARGRRCGGRCPESATPATHGRATSRAGGRLGTRNHRRGREARRRVGAASGCPRVGYCGRASNCNGKSQIPTLRPQIPKIPANDLGFEVSGRKARPHRVWDAVCGNANAIMSSLVTSPPVSPPPVLTTATYCRPSAPIYVTGVVSIDEDSLISQSLLPVAVANARNL